MWTRPCGWRRSDGVLSTFMSQLRWSLLILGVLFVAALAWWEWRRPRQASGGLERTGAREGVGSADAPSRVPREPLALPEMRAREPAAVRALPVIEREAPELDVPLHDTPATDVALPREEPSLGDLDALEVNAPTLGPAEPGASAGPAWVPPPEELPELPPAPPLLVEWPPEAQRRIVAVRLIAEPTQRFAGRSLRQALAAEGFVLGQFSIFHKPDEQRRAVLSAASLNRPGTFDKDTMDSQHYGGLSLFAVLPGPMPAAEVFEELVLTARNLNDRLSGVLQDERGEALTAERLQGLREQLRAEAAS